MHNDSGAYDVKVIIADESRLICVRIGSMLADIPAVDIVGMAHSAGDALAAVTRLLPDVVILDFRLPGTRGVELLRSIRAAAPQARVIMMMASPLVLAPYEKLCIDAGAAFLIDKTRDFAKLQAILAGLAEPA